MQKRIIIATFFIFALMTGLVGKLVFLQIIESSGYIQKASSQRIIGTDICASRGYIFDRNMIPLVNRDVYEKAVINPWKTEYDLKKIKSIADGLGVDIGELSEKINGSVPVIYEIPAEKKEALKDIKEVSILKYLGRYGKNSVARHVIGFVGKSDDIGKSGVEKAFDDVLSNGNRIKAGIITDARYRPIPGLGCRLVNTYDYQNCGNIKLTIDYHIQKAIEEVLEDSGYNCAAVVENIKNGDIVAMASKPDFDPNNVERYMRGENSELLNKAAAGYNIGSVFKIIVTAAALENGFSMRETFFCGGFAVVDGKEFRCSGNHGKIDLTKAFSHSCNSAFIQLALKIGPRAIIDMAKKFGITEKSEMESQGIDELKALIPDKQFYSRRETANISIGQGDILLSPARVADIAAIVANGGIKNNMNIVDSVIDNEGKTVAKIKKEKSQRVISRYTAQRIQRMMEETTKNGTGQNAFLEIYGSAGKTGTAQTGWMIDGSNAVHAWFAGYFPTGIPRYSISVFVLNGKSGSGVAAPIFREIAKKIADMNKF